MKHQQHSWGNFVKKPKTSNYSTCKLKYYRFLHLVTQTGSQIQGDDENVERNAKPGNGQAIDM